MLLLQMLHPSICSQLFEGWQPGMVYDHHMKFYTYVLWAETV
jgi:hypothetical protein